MPSKTPISSSDYGSIDRNHLRKRLLVTMAVLLIPLLMASSASVVFHQSAAVNSRYLMVLIQLVEGMAELKGSVAQIETGRAFDQAEAKKTYEQTLGLYSALRAVDPDGEEVMTASASQTRQALTDRTIEAAIEPAILSERLGLLGHDMPTDLAEIWEEEDSWSTSSAGMASLESSFGAILLAVAEIFADEKQDIGTLDRFWIVADDLSTERLSYVTSVLNQKSRKAGQAPIFLSALVLLIALFAAVFAWFSVAQPLVKEILRIQSQLREEAKAARSSDLAKTQFLATISHELRTPMNGVIGAAQLLELADLPEEDKELVDILNSCADGQMALIEEILTFGEIEAGALRMQPEEMDVKRLMQNATSFATVLAKKKGLSFQLNVSQDTPLILGDSKRLRQIIVNLVGNAVKFTEAGSVDVEAFVEQSVDSKNGVFRVVVTDTGPGIAPEHQESIFERFVQGDSSSSRTADGTGLGLSIALGIAHEAKGDISLESQLGVGSSFTFEMPTEIIAAPSGVSQDERNAA